MPNVTYVPHLVEAPETREALVAFTSDPAGPSGQGDQDSDNDHSLRRLKEHTSFAPIGVCVCDVNIEPFVAAELLVDHILPFMSNGSSSSGMSGGSSSSSGNDVGSNTNSESNSRVASSGYVILTLKLPRNPSARRIDTSFKIACNILSQQEAITSSRGRQRLLRSIPTPPLNSVLLPPDPSHPAAELGGGGKAARCWDFKMVHLNANSRNERTLVCRIGGAEGE